jgi:LPPG:FO 2-phospho-L-lactate transferase
MAVGFARALPANSLTVIVNVGDDDDFHGLRVCPDLDTVLYTLSGQVDMKQAWGVEGDATRALGVLKRLGAKDTWMTLGDADLGLHLYRTERLRAGATLTEITSEVAKSFGVNVRILPVSNNIVSTRVVTDQGALRFQEWFVKHRCGPRVRSLEFDGAQAAAATPEVIDALRDAELIVFAPSNPLLSILPILKIDGVDDRIRSSAASKVVVSPLINGQAVKGPLCKLMEELRLTPGNSGIAEFYEALIDGITFDMSDKVDAEGLKNRGLQVLLASTRIATAEAAETLARQMIEMPWKREHSGAIS